MRGEFRCVNIFARYKYGRPVLPANGDADQIRSVIFKPYFISRICFLFLFTLRTFGAQIN